MSTVPTAGAIFLRRGTASYIPGAAASRRASHWTIERTMLAEAARLYFSFHGPLVGTGCYEPPSNLGGDYKGATVGTSPAFSFGSSVCEVEVDPERARSGSSASRTPTTPAP